MLVSVASGGHCWPSPGKLAHSGPSGPTPVGAGHPSAVADDEVLTVSPPLGLPWFPLLPSPFPRVMALRFVLDINSRSQRGLYSCRTNNEKNEKLLHYWVGKARGNTPSSPFPVCRNVHSSIPCKESVGVSDQAPLSVLDPRKPS